MSRRKNPEEGHTVGLALFFLRRDAGMILRQLSAATGKRHRAYIPQPRSRRTTAELAGVE